MAIRIAGFILPAQKKIAYSLPYLYGIGMSNARQILTKLEINEDTRTSELTEGEANKLREYIEKNYKVEGDLRREVMGNIKRLREIGSYRGSRHAKGLPARGQRTKTNSRTRRGNVRKTATSGKRAVTKT